MPVRWGSVIAGTWPPNPSTPPLDPLVVRGDQHLIHHAAGLGLLVHMLDHRLANQVDQRFPGNREDPYRAGMTTVTGRSRHSAQGIGQLAAVTVAVPTMPTTTRRLIGGMAGLPHVGSGRRASASVPTTVSPAPVTS